MSLSQYIVTQQATEIYSVFFKLKDKHVLKCKHSLKMLQWA